MQRSIKELLELMLKHEDLFETGLCKWANELYVRSIIKPNEFMDLKVFIKNNRFTAIISIKDFLYRKYLSDYYWKAGEITPRIHWIKYQIKKL